MSQEYYNSKGKSPRGRNDDRTTTPPPSSGRPAYMTVGSGSTSQHAARLQSLLDNDSGYGGSVAGDDVSSSSKYPLGSPRIDPTLSGHIPRHSPSSAEHDHRTQAAAVHQLWYNQHRASLSRSISKALELLKTLQEMNITWPAHYPSVQRSDTFPSERPSSRPGLQHVSSMRSGSSSPSPHARPLRRSMTTFDDQDAAESSKYAENRSAVDAPRLVTNQIAQEFSVLKLDLKL
ncbi:hypothetical protein F4779DRAFT_623376, partial [Xylariaceae sp. FL0662B]